MGSGKKDDAIPRATPANPSIGAMVPIIFTNFSAPLRPSNSFSAVARVVEARFKPSTAVYYSATSEVTSTKVYRFF